MGYGRRILSGSTGMEWPEVWGPDPILLALQYGVWEVSPYPAWAHTRPILLGGPYFFDMSSAQCLVTRVS